MNTRDSEADDVAVGGSAGTAGPPTMVRTTLAVNDTVFQLSQGEDGDALRLAMETALRAGGAFVSFSVVGNRTVSVLIGPSTQITFSIETVAFDARDTGDLDEPFGGLFDY